MKAIWNNTVIAESDSTIVVENNHYFPPSSIHKPFFVESDHSSHCFWKGKASYYDVVVDGKTNKQAAWYYLDPNKKAAEIQGYIAFWHGVEVVD